MNWTGMLTTSASRSHLVFYSSFFARRRTFSIFVHWWRGWDFLVFIEQRNTRDCHLSVQYYYPCQPRTGLPSKNPLDPMLLNFNDQMEDGKSRKSSPEFWIVLLTGLISSLPRFYLLEISCISAKTFFSFSKQPIPNQKRREVKSVSPFKIIVSIH